MNREQKMAMSHKACRRLLEIAARDEWTTHEIVDAATCLDLQNVSESAGARLRQR
jgi:acyl-CoA oxidase